MPRFRIRQAGGYSRFEAQARATQERARQEKVLAKRREQRAELEAVRDEQLALCLTAEDVAAVERLFSRF